VSEKWSKGEPVSLKDLLRITPLVQELMQASEELNVSVPDLLWLMKKLADDAKDFSTLDDIQEMELEDLLEPKRLEFSNGFSDLDEENEELRDLDDEDEPVDYMVNVKISGSDRFPEVSFRAGIADKADLTYFFEWLADMVEKLE